MAPPGTPIGSSRAVVVAYGACSRPCAIQTRAVGRSISRDCLSTTRKLIRLVPTAWSDVPATTATSSPGARQSCSSVSFDDPAVGSPDASFELPPPHEEARSAVPSAITTAAAKERLTPSNVDDRSRTAAHGSEGVMPARGYPGSITVATWAADQSPSENVKLGSLN